MASSAGVGGRIPATLLLLTVVGILVAPGAGVLAGVSSATPTPHRAPGHDGASSSGSPVLIATHPPAWAPVRSPGAPVKTLAGAVDPFAFHTTEPAPMGLTDYGVDSAGRGYTYTTPIWQADANISRLLAYYPTNASGNGLITFQLNVVVKFTGPAPLHSQYYYWIQDVVVIDTMQKVVQFVNNIWNFSAGSGQLDSGSLSGNGSVNFCPASTCGVNVWWYADSPSCTFRGNCVTLHYPGVVAERVVTSTVGGVPRVAFEYNDLGNGWVTYDNASFPFAKNWTDNGFVVDGTNYAPFGTFANAEWDYTGPPGGATTIDRNSALRMSMEFWNGHNFQSPPNTFNFGSNTGELIESVVTASTLTAANGSLASNLTTGSGSLGALYYRSDVAMLNVSSPNSPNGTLWVNGGAHEFRGGMALVTLAPGTYHLVLTNSSGTITQTNVTLTANGYTRISMGLPFPYAVHIVESGLPAGTNWTVTLPDGAHLSSSTGFDLQLFNGSYNYTVTPVPGYTIASYAGTLVVSGQAVTLSLVFTVFTYTLSFTQTGLTSGTSWWVTVGGGTLTSKSTSLSVPVANGTYPYTAGAGSAYLADPAAGNVTILARSSTEAISFSLAPGFLAGILEPTNATLRVGGVIEPTVSGTFNVSLLPGRYAVVVSAGGYTTNQTNVTIAAGNLTWFTLSLQLLPPPDGTRGSTATPASSGLSIEEVVLIVAVAAVLAAAVVGAAVVLRGRR